MDGVRVIQVLTSNFGGEGGGRVTKNEGVEKNIG